jgi:multicomponent Na+:H+ antiporter subunit D
MMQATFMLGFLLPILASSGILLLGSRKNLAYSITSFTTIVLFCLSCITFYQILKHGEVLYHFGGWIPPIGIEFKLSKINSFFVLLVSLVALLTFVQGRKILFYEVEAKKINVFCAVFLIAVVGFIGVVLTNDFFNLYVFIEVSSIATYALVAISKNRASVRAAFYYLIIGTVAATFILVGIGYIYAASGTLNISDFILKLPLLKDHMSIKLGFVLMLAGLLVKSGLFPLHNWFVQSYSSTSAFILPFLSSTSSKIYMFLVVKLVFMIFGLKFSFEGTNISIILGTLGVLAMLVGAFAALSKNNLREILIFSSISQIGYIFIAISIGSKAGIVAAIIFLISNILAKTSMFILSSHIYLSRGSYSISKLYDIKRQIPVAVFLFIINGASIVGVPITVGFVAKVGLITSLIEGQMWLMLSLVLVSSFMSLLYMWRVVECFLYDKRGRIDSHERYPAKFTLPRHMTYLSMFSLGAITLVNISCSVFFREFFDFINKLVS